MRILIGMAAVTAVIWIMPFLVSVESGIKFGIPYRVFFTLIVLFSGFLFYLLRASPMPPLKSMRKALGIVAVVFIASVGIVVLFANFAPQFTFEGATITAATPPERGKAIFNDPNTGCFLCHIIGGAGGTRGPDLSHIATVAGKRRSGMSAEDYLKESLLNPGDYVVPSYDNIMPPVAQRLSPDKLADLIVYLTTLK